MGVDSNLLINAKYNVKDVVKLITALGAKNIEERHLGDHSFVTFDVEGMGYRRQLYVAQSASYGVEATLLMWRSNEEGIAFLKKIAAVVGGLLLESDSTSDFEGFQSPHEGNAEFVLKHTILTKAVTSKEADVMVDAMSEAIGYK
jgi:hypothetical protein